MYKRVKCQYYKHCFITILRPIVL